MSFLSLSYGVFLIIGMMVYYIIPKKGQWLWLLFLGMFFYATSSIKASLFLIFSIGTSYFYGVYVGKIFEQKNECFVDISSVRNRGKIEREDSKAEDSRVASVNKQSKWLLLLTIIVNLFVLFVLKIGIHMPFFPSVLSGRLSLIVPIGISFYTLQIIAYMVDVYKGKIKPERNLLKYALFVSFFPQILQGPIPRYDRLAPQFFKEHKFSYRMMTDNLLLMLWGFFQKMVVADNAAIVVNRIYGEYELYGGFYIVLAVFLYSIQLYADFAGCVCIARASTGLFGIELEENFRQPYFSCSVKEFWGRWHMTLSGFLKDYVYIPLGGNRHGRCRKYLNLLLTFLVSGIWHGAGLTFLVWGLLHGVYQVLEDVLRAPCMKLMEKMEVNCETFSFRLLVQIKTFVLVAIAWVFFRASSVRQALVMLKNMVCEWNPYVLFDESFYMLGLNGKEFRMLFFAIGVMWFINVLQTKIRIRENFAKQNLVFRWTIIFIALFAVIIFGVYGPGYDAAQFIYGNF